VSGQPDWDRRVGETETEAAVAAAGTVVEKIVAVVVTVEAAEIAAAAETVETAAVAAVVVAVGGTAAELLVGQPVLSAGRIGHCLEAAEVPALEEMAAGAEIAVAVAED